MSSIKLKHAAGNSVSVAAPATNPAADRTINLNDNYAGDGSFVTANSSGNVGLNTASPSTKLSLEGADGSTSNGILIGAKNAGGIRGAIEVHTAASTVGFNLSRTGGGSDTDVVRLEMDGDSNGLIQVRNSSNTQRVRLDNHGIKFGTDTAAANALDDYEEGNWTPIIRGGSTAGTGTYVNRYGRYTKVGNMVTCWYHVNWSNLTGASGYLAVGDLPYTVRTTNDWQQAGTVFLNNIDLPATCMTVVSHQWNGSQDMAVFYMTRDDAGWDGVNLDSSGGVVGTFTYPVS